MKHPFRFFVIGFALGLVSCENTFDVDLGSMSAIPEVNTLDFSRVHPASAHEYWELRFSCCDNAPDVNQILGAGGTKTRGQLDAATVAALDAARPENGFSAGCLPGHCFKYIASVNGSVNLHTTRQALLIFLGEINTAEEAVLLLDSFSYSWTTDEKTGMRQVNGGWEFVVFQLVRACTPVQTDRVHVLIRRNGEASVLQREVWDRDPNSCV
jgi:hypothetical protein